MKNARLFLLIFLVAPLISGAKPKFVESELQLNTGTGILNGTLCVPKAKKAIPVALIIAGSGPTDRNGNNPVMKNDALKKIAHGLAAKGIASLRYDKRGIAASAAAMKSEEELLFSHYADDAKGWINLLKSDQRFGSLTIIGHSEGSLVGMLAAEKADRFISLAGAGRPIDVVLREQLSSLPDELRGLSNKYLDSLKAGRRIANPDQRLMMLFRPSVQPYMISWLKHDPAEIISRMQIPVMIVQGTKDVQVAVTDAQLLYAAQPKARYLLIEKMNHVLRTIEGDADQNLVSYSDDRLPLSKPLLPGMTGFILGK